LEKRAVNIELLVYILLGANIPKQLINRSWYNPSQILILMQILYMSQLLYVLPMISTVDISPIFPKHCMCFA